jgi:hypothetical protein
VLDNLTIIFFLVSKFVASKPAASAAQAKVAFPSGLQGNKHSVSAYMERHSDEFRSSGVVVFAGGLLCYTGHLSHLIEIFFLGDEIVSEATIDDNGLAARCIYMYG